MATTVVRTNNMENGFTIVTHVIPMQSTPTGAGQNESETRAGFFSRLPARNTDHEHSTPGSGRTASMLGILGTMQLMTGVVSFMLAIVLSQHTDPRFFTLSLHGYWGSVIYISAGSFSVAAKNKTHRCLVKASLAVNTLSVLTAGVATILLSLDLAYGPDCSTLEHCASYHCDVLKTRTNGINGVLLVLSLLQFVVSILVSLNVLDPFSRAETGVCATNPFPFPGAPHFLNSPICANANEEGLFVISNPNINGSAPSLTAQPPEYSEIEPQFQQ